MLYCDAFQTVPLSPPAPCTGIEISAYLTAIAGRIYRIITVPHFSELDLNGPI